MFMHLCIIFISNAKYHGYLPNNYYMLSLFMYLKCFMTKVNISK